MMLLVGFLGLLAICFAALWSVEREDRQVAERERDSIRTAHQQRQADYAAAVENNDYLQARVDSLTEQRDALQAKLDELHGHVERHAEWWEKKRQDVLKALDEVQP